VTVFSAPQNVTDFADCERRLGLFVDAYNFQRPHQGIEGLVEHGEYGLGAALGLALSLCFLAKSLWNS
jgi:hypothetical protein